MAVSGPWVAILPNPLESQRRGRFNAQSSPTSKGPFMLKGKLLHPQILHALARAGHGAKVLISDGNYPHWPKHGPNAEVVFLNLAPGQVLVSDVLRTVLSAIPIEKAEV